MYIISAGFSTAMDLWSVPPVVQLGLFHEHSQGSAERVICVQQLPAVKETLQQALGTSALG